MIAKKYFISICLTSVSLLLFVGCRVNEDFAGKLDSINKEQVEFNDSEGRGSAKIKSESITTISPESNDEVLHAEDKNEKLDSTNNEESKPEIFGTWSLEKIVLKSEAYDGTSKEALGGIDEEDYVGLELEFTDKYLRLGEEKFLYPKYILEYMTVAEYNDCGKYKLPSTYGVILDQNIDIANSEKYEWLSEIPLKFYQANFDEDYFIPVGTQVVVLNNDIMLVGIWGKIILARRVKT